MFDIVDAGFSYEKRISRLLISVAFLQVKRK